MSVLITPEQLSRELSSALIIDCRFDLAKPEDGRQRFDREHIPGAQYVSLDADLSAPISEHGGRHPLPSIEALQVLFSRLGIERERTAVVIYDDEGGCYAARLWWMLTYCGHDDVRLLDGGWSAWKKSGGSSTSEPFNAIAANFIAHPQSQLLATMADVRDRGSSDILFDCRASERFSGSEENLDVKAGHIPGALNVPWRELVDENGMFVGVARMAEALSVAGDRSIMYCGSGVTACVCLLSAVQAGLDLPRLYAGSWSDWISYEANPIAIGSQ